MGGDWDFPLLEELIQDRGDLVVWEKGIANPGRADDPRSGLIDVDGKPGRTRDISDDHDGGTGYVYRDARVIKGLITSVESGRNRRLIELGYAVPGDCVFSPSMTVGTISDFDKITFTWPVNISEGQVIMRNAANLEENAVVDSGITADEDKLWYMPAEIIWCEDSLGRIYQPGADFTVSPDTKKLTWVGAKRPDDGQNYTLKYTAYLEWIAYATPMTRYDAGRNLAQRVTLKKAHVAHLRSELDTPTARAAEEVGYTDRMKL